jgi:hypothetical protein
MKAPIILYDSDGNACALRRPMGFDRAVEMQPLAPSDAALENVVGTLQVRTPEWWEATEERLRAKQ